MTQFSDERGAEMRELFFETAQELLQSLNEDALKLERDLFEGVFHTSDSQVGVQSFLEHGPGKAQFTGQ